MKTKPMQHQTLCNDTMKDREYFALLLEQGLGKTRIAIQHAQDLHLQGKLDRVLVLAPSGVHANWAEEELKIHTENPHSFTWISTKTSMRYVRQLDSFISTQDSRLRWLCMNIEAVRTKRGFDACTKFLRNGKSMIIVDESSVIKNPKAQQTRAVLKLAKFSTYRLILNGTPVTQGPLDLWSQCLFLSRDALPYNSYTSFKHQFAQTVMMPMGTRSFEKIVGYKNLPELEEAIKPFSIRLEKKDCLDLPEKMYRKMSVPLTPEQTKVYDSIRYEQMCILEAEEKETGKVSVPSVLAVLTKLQQVTCGFVIDDESKIHELPNNRITYMLNSLGEAPPKTVIWSTYRYPIVMIMAALEKAYGKCALEYHGGIDQQVRTANIAQFQNDPDIRFMVCSYAGARGITLHSASNVIYFANNYSLDKRLQSEDRTHRIGQKNSCLYTDLFTPDTVDMAILRALQSKKELANTVVTSDWRAILSREA